MNHHHPRHQRRGSSVGRRSGTVRRGHSATDSSTAGTLTISDVDSPADVFSRLLAGRPTATFGVYDTAGAWTYTPNNADAEVDAAGSDTLPDSFLGSAADGTPTSVTINILGTNDAAVLSADVQEPD